MKFIHCSDLHLDSKMESNLSPSQARERSAEILATFARMVDYAAANGVAAVLIAGDLFDGSRVTAQTAQFVLEQVRKAETVDFLYLRGNHDEKSDVFQELEIPENFKTIGTEWTYFRYDDVVVAGLEMTRGNCFSMYDELKLSEGDTNIVMLHGQSSTQPGEELVALPRLRGKSIRYLALGHIHSYQEEALDLEGRYAYCGCLEGRGFDECGEKGFVLLETRNGRVETEFVPFAERTLHEVKVDITELVTIGQIQGAMERLSDGIPEKDLVKFTLTGGYTLQTQKDPRLLKKLLEGRFYFVKLKDESRLIIDRASYENDVSLKGEFIRLVMASDRAPEEKEQIILWGIRALSGEEVEA